MSARERQQPRLVAFLNAYTEGMSGGDACFIEVALRFTGVDAVVVTSDLGARACLARRLRAAYWITTREATFGRTIPTYLVRMALGTLLSLRLRSDDVVYATSDFLPDTLPAFVHRARSRSAKWVQKVFHIIPPSRPVSHYAQRASHALIRRYADLIIVGSELLREQLVAAGFPPGKLAVNYPGVDSSQFTPPAGPHRKVYDAAYLGRIHPSKGLNDLVDIWQAVHRCLPGARLAVIGRGETRVVDALRRRITHAGLGANIRLLGHLAVAEVIQALYQTRVFVFPSPEEGFGMAILEAIACNLPVVAWDLPIYREVFPAGIVAVPIGERRTFAAAILRLVRDEAERDRIVTGGRALTQRYDWDHVARRELDLIREVNRG